MVVPDVKEACFAQESLVLRVVLPRVRVRVSVSDCVCSCVRACVSEYVCVCVSGVSK